MKPVSPNRLLAVAVEAARKAGAIQRANWGKRLDIRMKGRIDPVTSTDTACEAAIVRTLRRAFPDHGLLAEEGGGDRFAPPDRPVWIIDPLDGTVNFAHAYPRFCCSIAAVIDGRPVAGVVYDPVMDELFSAVRGGGARLNGRRIRVSAVNRLESALLATGFAYNVATARRNNIGTLGRMLKRVQAVRRDGSAALNLCYVACGRFDGFWELYLKAWDIAAGSLILEEAGGKVSGYRGRSLDLFGSEIAASNGRIHRELLGAIAGRRIS